MRWDADAATDLPAERDVLEDRAQEECPALEEAPEGARGRGIAEREVLYDHVLEQRPVDHAFDSPAVEEPDVLEHRSEPWVVIGQHPAPFERTLNEVFVRDARVDAGDPAVD